MKKLFISVFIVALAATIIYATPKYYVDNSTGIVHSQGLTTTGPVVAGSLTVTTPLSIAFSQVTGSATVAQLPTSIPFSKLVGSDVSIPFSQITGSVTDSQLTTNPSQTAAMNSIVKTAPTDTTIDPNWIPGLPATIITSGTFTPGQVPIYSAMSDTISLGTVSSLVCATTFTVAVSGATDTMVAVASPQTQTSGTTISAWVSAADVVSVEVCALTSPNVAITDTKYNIRVIQ